MFWEFSLTSGLYKLSEYTILFFCLFAKKGRNCIGLKKESWQIHFHDVVRSVILEINTDMFEFGIAKCSFVGGERCWLRTILICPASDDWIFIRAHEGQGRWGGGCHTVRHSHRITTMATRIKGQSEKEREGHSDNNGTVSFLRLPFLILGDGGAVDCGVLHVVDEWWIYILLY